MSPRVLYIWSEALQAASDDLPANTGRSSMVHSLIKEMCIRDSSSGWPFTIVAPDLQYGSPETLKRYHTAEYVDAILARDHTDGVTDGEAHPAAEGNASPFGLEHDCPWFSSLPQYALQVAAATLTACHALATGEADIAINWDGGRHHAQRGKASGFCYVADIVLGVMLLARQGRPRSLTRSGRPRILYLDLDLHYGDGVANAFRSPTSYRPDYPEGARIPRPPQVLTLSIHHASPTFFPSCTTASQPPLPTTSEPFNLSIPLEAYPSSATYAKLFTTCVEPIKDAFNPDYVVLQLGVDGLPNDRIGRLGGWAIHGKGGVGWCIEQVKSWDIPLCVLGGGGYDHANTARAWTAATSILTNSSLLSETPIPHHDFFPAYAPSFTMEIEPTYRADENSTRTLDAMAESFRTIAKRIRQIVQAAK